MSDGVVETVLARCVLEPRFIDEIRLNPRAALSRYRLDDATLSELEAADFEKIRRFSGFISKVQHNHLWESFPATRRLVRFQGVEHDLFTAYREVESAYGPRRLSHRDERTERFLRFLERFVSDRRKASGTRILLDVLRHERAIWQVRRSALALAEDSGGPEPRLPCSDESYASLRWKDFQRLVPFVRGIQRITTFETDPAKALQWVAEGFRGRPPRPSPRILLYWAMAPSLSVRALELDRISAHLLLRVDARRSVRSVVASLRGAGLRGVAAAAFRGLFDGTTAEGLIGLRPPGR